MMDDRLINEKYDCCQDQGTKAEDFMNHTAGHHQGAMKTGLPPLGSSNDDMTSNNSLKNAKIFLKITKIYM